MWTRIVYQIARRKSVLYVCDRINSNSGCAMATTRDRSSSRYATSRQSPQQKTQGFPFTISMSDGETEHHQHHPVLRANGGPDQEAEVVRCYLKPPENKSLSDMEGFQRSCSMGVLGDRDEWGSSKFMSSSDRMRSSTSSSHPQHRHSAPLRGSGTSSGGAMCYAGGSPRGKKASFPMFTFLSPSRDKSQDAKTRQLPRVPSILANAPLDATTLAGIAVVPCGDTSYPGDDRVCDMRDEAPPMYSDVIENPNFCRNDSIPKQRTSSGKI